MADALVSGTSGQPCRFDSCHQHQKDFMLYYCLDGNKFFENNFVISYQETNALEEGKIGLEKFIF